MEFWIIIFFLFGAAFGSFINMLIWRLHTGESLMGRSYCDHSKKQLKPIDLIPIFSFLIFKGKCRECGKKIPILYPVVEFIAGALFALAFIKSYANFFDIASPDFNFGFVILGAIILGIFLLIELFFGYFDYLYWEIESRSVYVSLGITLLIVLLGFITPLPFIGDPLNHLLGGILLAGIIGLVYILSKKGGMGEGDIFLFGITGLMLGVEGGLVAFFITVMSGSIIGIIKSIKTKKIKDVKIQLAPFIAFGTIIALFFHEEIIGLYLSMLV